jgi:hypothetical protein
MYATTSGKNGKVGKEKNYLKMYQESLNQHRLIKQKKEIITGKSEIITNLLN